MGMFGQAFKPGGVGRNIAGYLGDALLTASGHDAQFGPQMNARKQQELEFQQQLALAQAKAQYRAPTALQQNYEYLQQQNPQLAEQYLRAQANPMTLSTDPATGLARFTPKGGVPGMNVGDEAPTTKQLPNGQTAYWVNGAWYDNPEGRE